MRERRKSPRYKVTPDTLYVFAPKTNMLWEIKDIGKAGLAFEYQPISEEKEMESIEITKIRQRQYRLADMPCKVIYDIPTISQDRGFRGTEYRRRGLNYGRLTKGQEMILSLLLDDRDFLPTP